MKVTGVFAFPVNARTGRANPADAPYRDSRADSSATVGAPDFGKTLAARKEMRADGASIADIMAGMSLRHIRYTELVSVAGKLRDAGLLAAKDYLDFIGPSPEFARVDGSRDPDWNQPMDMIGRHEKQLEFMVSSDAEQRFIDFEQHLLDLYRKFEA